MKQHLKNTFLLLPIAASLPVQAQEKSESPNLVFIMADQWRGDALGCLGKEPVPNSPLRPACVRRSALHQCSQLLPCFITGTGNLDVRYVSHE